jgi:hypothetical protein
MNFFKRIDTATMNSTTLDFSYVEIQENVVPTRHIVDLHGDTISRVDILTFTPPFGITPNVGEQCAFEGAVKPSTYPNAFNENRPVYETEIITYEGLKYLRRENDFCVFQLPFEHPGHEWFKGCSGAPILNPSGRPVGLVASGDIDSNEIFAIALDALIPVVESTLDYNKQSEVS